MIDNVNVGVLLNVLDNHFGLNGIPNRQHLLHVKRQVIDIATDLAILNADDPLCMSLARSATARHLGLISLDIKNPFISNHVNSGGLAGVVSGDGKLLVLDKKRQIISAELANFPVSLGGTFGVWH